MDKDKLYVELSDQNEDFKNSIRDKMNNTVWYSKSKFDTKIKFFFTLFIFVIICLVIIFTFITCQQNRRIKELSDIIMTIKKEDFPSYQNKLEKEMKMVTQNLEQVNLASNLEIEKIKNDMIKLNQNLDEKDIVIKKTKKQIKKMKLKLNELFPNDENLEKDSGDNLNVKPIIIKAKYLVDDLEEETLLFTNDFVDLEEDEYSIELNGEPIESDNLKLFDYKGEYKVTFYIKKELKTIKGLFKGCGNLIELDLSGLANLHLVDTSEMLVNCFRLTSLDISGLDTSLVTDMTSMFEELESLESLDISHFNTSLVKDMSYMFFGMISIKSIDLSSFNTSRVSNMERMFRSMNSISSLNLSNFDTSSVINMKQMFTNMLSLESLNLSKFDTSLVKNMEGMFYGNNLLKTLDIRNFNVNKETKLNEIFDKMPDQSDVTIIYDSSKVQSEIINKIPENWTKKDLNK